MDGGLQKQIAFRLKLFHSIAVILHNSFKMLLYFLFSLFDILFEAVGYFYREIKFLIFSMMDNRTRGYVTSVGRQTFEVSVNGVYYYADANTNFDGMPLRGIRFDSGLLLPGDVLRLLKISGSHIDSVTFDSHNIRVGFDYLIPIMIVQTRLGPGQNYYRLQGLNHSILIANNCCELGDVIPGYPAGPAIANLLPMFSTGFIRFRQTNAGPVGLWAVFYRPMGISFTIYRCRRGSNYGYTANQLPVCIPHGVLRQAGLLPPYIARQRDLEGRFASAWAVPSFTEYKNSTFTAIMINLEGIQELGMNMNWEESEDSGVSSD